MTKKISKKEDKQPDKKKKKDLFTKGFGTVRNRVRKGSRFTMSCYNCDYFYQAVGDKEEVCQNLEVLKYDMVVTESSIYCSKWSINKRAETVKGLFKKGKIK